MIKFILPLLSIFLFGCNINGTRSQSISLNTPRIPLQDRMKFEKIVNFISGENNDIMTWSDITATINSIQANANPPISTVNPLTRIDFNFEDDQLIAYNTLNDLSHYSDNYDKTIGMDNWPTVKTKSAIIKAAQVSNFPTILIGMPYISKKHGNELRIYLNECIKNMRQTKAVNNNYEPAILVKIYSTKTESVLRLQINEIKSYATTTETGTLIEKIFKNTTFKLLDTEGNTIKINALLGNYINAGDYEVIELYPGYSTTIVITADPRAMRLPNKSLVLEETLFGEQVTINLR